MVLQAASATLVALAVLSAHPSSLRWRACGVSGCCSPGYFGIARPCLNTEGCRPTTAAIVASFSLSLSIQKTRRHFWAFFQSEALDVPMSVPSVSLQRLYSASNSSYPTAQLQHPCTKAMVLCPVLHCKINLYAISLL